MILKLIRKVLGALILAFDRMFRPRALERLPDAQARVDAETAGWAMYQFEACPFCVKTRRAMQRLGLRIELRNAARDQRHADELVRGGGELQVPCLRIPGSGGAPDRWMYESNAIVAFLESKFGASA